MEGMVAVFMMGLVLGQFMDLGIIVLDGSWMTKIGKNPFGPGALNYINSLDEIGTVSTALSLLPGSSGGVFLSDVQMQYTAPVLSTLHCL